MTTRPTLPFINPATGEQFGQVAMTTPAEIAQAHQELRRNSLVWSQKSPAERAAILKKFQKLLIDYTDEITTTINQDTGKSRQDALSELFLVVNKLDEYRKRAPQWLAPERISPGLYFFKRYYAEPRPYGVVGIIGPWNLPLDLTIPPAVSALLAGNTVLLKPSEVTAATGVLIEKLFQSVPELSPYIRVLHGDGSVGAALVQSRPDLIFLTGSVQTGRRVAMAAAEQMIPFLCELGGKDPMIVLDDADIPQAARWGAWGAYFHSGQTCVSVERIYVLEAVYDQFVQQALEETKKVKLGYSPDIANPNHIGPLSFERQVGIIEDHLQDALAKGAKILYGGQRQGMFMEPTLIVDVDHSMKLMREETFGPIMPIMKVKDEAEAIRLANDSHYGLSACVWSRNWERAEQVARQLEVGSAVINDSLAHYAVPLLPFGGVKGSGTARTHSKQEVLQFTQTRSYGVGGAPVALDIATRLRNPNHYHTAHFLLHTVFGVTPEQKLRPFRSLVKNKPEGSRPGRTLAALTLLSTAAILALGLLRAKK